MFCVPTAIKVKTNDCSAQPIVRRMHYNHWFLLLLVSVSKTCTERESIKILSVEFFNGRTKSTEMHACSAMSQRAPPKNGTCRLSVCVNIFSLFFPEMYANLFLVKFNIVFKLHSDVVSHFYHLSLITPALSVHTHTHILRTGSRNTGQQILREPNKTFLMAYLSYYDVQNQ